MKGKSRLINQKISQVNIRRVIIFVNLNKAEAMKLGDDIKAELESRNIVADFCLMKGKPEFDSKTRYDAAITLGGDGTVLTAARLMSPLGAPVFPVNMGTFGFIAGIQIAEWREVLDLWLDGKAHVSRRLMLELSVERGNAGVFRACCLNDVVVSASGIAKIIKLSVSCVESGLPGKTLRLGSYRSDGLIISTPTGSTAYSMAAGGPIVDPELEAVILNPICPFTLSNRPLMLPAGDTVIVDVENRQRSGVLLTVDGQVTEGLESGDRIILRKAPYYCLLVASGRTGFFDTLRTKFAWSDWEAMPPQPAGGFDHA